MSNIKAIEQMRIRRMLSLYPCLEKIIHRDSLFYQTTHDQYSGGTPDGRKALTLGGVLLELYDVRELIEMMDNLNKWICLYPDYKKNKLFEKNIKKDVYNFYSEIEVFHQLKVKGLNPELNPKINSDSGKNLDFAICLETNRLFLEVITPTVSDELDKQIEDEEIVCGFGDMEKGIGPKNKEPHSRLATLLVKEIEKHHLSSERVEAPIIFIVNNHYSKLEIPGIQNPFDSAEFPEYICGILVYDHNGKSRFFVNPKCRMGKSYIQFFEELYNPKS